MHPDSSYFYKIPLVHTNRPPPPPRQILWCGIHQITPIPPKTEVGAWWEGGRGQGHITNYVPNSHNNPHIFNPLSIILLFLLSITGLLSSKNKGLFTAFSYTWCAYTEENVHKLTEEQVLTAPYFKDVFSDFLKWIVSVCNTSKFVITAHNGSVCDFPFLMKYIRMNNLGRRIIC